MTDEMCELDIELARDRIQSYEIHSQRGSRGCRITRRSGLQIFSPKERRIHSI